MAFNLKLKWHRPVKLREGNASDPLFYMCDHLSEIPMRCGAYIFGRQFGEQVEPIYIGKAKDLRKRVLQHLEGNVPLMKAIMLAKNGARVILACELFVKQGQKQERCLDVLERTLIRLALAQGHELLNVQGVKTPNHTLDFGGAREGTRFSGLRTLSPAE